MHQVIRVRESPDANPNPLDGIAALALAYGLAHRNRRELPREERHVSAPEEQVQQAYTMLTGRTERVERFHAIVYREGREWYVCIEPEGLPSHADTHLTLDELRKAVGRR